MTTPEPSPGLEPVLQPIHTENDRNIVEDGRLAQLRKDALRVIQTSGKAEALAAILEMFDNPRLLDPKSNADDYPDSLLEWAVREGSVDCVKLLLKTGADPKKSQLRPGFLPVHLMACCAKNMSKQQMRDMADALSAAGADFDALDEDWSPLHYAIHSGSPWMVEILIERGVKVDPNLLDDPAVEAKLIPAEGEDDHPYALEALRVLRSKLLEDSILSAMPGGGDGPATNASRGMTL